MNYKEFQKSASRHLETCKQLLLDVDRKDVKTTTKHKLLNETYYLSGYVLEAMLSYSVCSFRRVSGDCMQSSPFTEDSGKFKTHNLKQKYRYAIDVGLTSLKSLAFFQTVHTNRDVQKLFDDWDVKYRYEMHKLVNKENLEMYIEEIENIYKTISKKYPI